MHRASLPVCDKIFGICIRFIQPIFHMQLLYIFLEYFVNKLNQALFYLDYVIHIQILYASQQIGSQFRCQNVFMRQTNNKRMNYYKP